MNTDKDWYPRPGDFIYLVDGDHVLRLDKIEMDVERIEEYLINVEKSEALVKWENLYTRLWNIEARLSKLERG